MTQPNPARLRQTAALVAALLPGLQAAHAASVPATLAGEWTSGSISPVEYYDPAAGKWADASGTSSILRIRPDGTYEQTDLLSVTTYGCTSKLLMRQEGAVKVQGAQVTFAPKTSRAVGYMCSPGKTYEKRNHVQGRTVSWTVQNDGKKVLRLTNEEGGSTAYDGR